MQRIQAFEAFVPSKSKILRPEGNATVSKSNVNVNTKSKVAGLFARLKHDRNALSIVQSNLDESSNGVSTVDIKADRPATAKVIEKNLRTISKFSIGIGPRNPKLLFRLDVEANFDLKPILACNDIEYPNGTSGVLRSCCLPDSSYKTIVQQKLRKWMDSHRTWLYPDRPVSSASMKVNGVVADLAPCDFWQEPSLQDVSYVSIIKRRRLKWQGALCSAVDELLLEPKSVGRNGGCNLPDGQRMESFYILGSDSEISDSNISEKDTDGFGNQQAAKCLPMSAVFFRNQRSDNSNCENINHSCESDFRKNRADEINFLTDEDVSCILTGAKKSFLDRVIKLGANPMEMTNKQELIRVTAAENRNKKPNRNISSAGRLQVRRTVGISSILYFAGDFVLVLFRLCCVMHACVSYDVITCYDPFILIFILLLNDRKLHLVELCFSLAVSL
jgi:hypothetical protein